MNSLTFQGYICVHFLWKSWGTKWNGTCQQIRSIHLFKDLQRGKLFWSKTTHVPALTWLRKKNTRYLYVRVTFRKGFTMDANRKAPMSFSFQRCPCDQCQLDESFHCFPKSSLWKKKKLTVWNLFRLIPNHSNLTSSVDLDFRKLIRNVSLTA